MVSICPALAPGLADSPVLGVFCAGVGFPFGDTPRVVPDPPVRDWVSGCRASPMFVLRTLPAPGWVLGVGCWVVIDGSLLGCPIVCAIVPALAAVGTGAGPAARVVGVGAGMGDCTGVCCTVETAVGATGIGVGGEVGTGGAITGAAIS